MALETLKDVKEIGGFIVFHGSPCRNDSPSDAYIMVDHSQNSLHFKIQNRPIKEAGSNGCQLQTILETCEIMLKKLNDKFPCVENETAWIHLNNAIFNLKWRTRNREARGVEGTSNA